MSSVFISYSRKDESFARQVATALSDRGFDVWIDVEDIPAGMKWSSAIQQGLDTANAMIVVLSPDSMGSTNVEDEWQYFLDQRKLVLPVLLRETRIHFQLSRIQYIDFMRPPFEAAFDVLYAELLRKGLMPGVPTSRAITPVKPLWQRVPAWGWGAGAVTLAALLLILLVLPGLNGDGSATRTPTQPASATVPPSASPTRTRRPILSPEDLTATEVAAFALAETQLAQTDVAETAAANAPAATLAAAQTATADALTSTAEMFTSTPTPNRLQTLVAQRATGTFAAGQTATISAQTPSATPAPSCEAALPPRLVVDGLGRVVVEGLPQRVRIAPSFDAAITALLDPGSGFLVADGPICDQATGVLWWRIIHEGINGWSAEGQGETYFLEPVQ